MELNILDITSLLYLESLSEEEITRIKKYIQEYLDVLNEYQISPNGENTRNLFLLSKPLNEVFLLNNPRIINGKNYPAIEIIKNSIDEYGRKIEKEIVESGKEIEASKHLVPSYYGQGHSITEDFNKSANAFWQAPLIIGLSLIIGVLLATLLFFIK